MCGRFTNRLTWREIVALYRLSVPAQPERNLPGRYNICPTDTINTVVEPDGKRDLVPMRWGLVPWWWKKKIKEMPATFNARAETVAEKPMFRDAFRRSRCLIPASLLTMALSRPARRLPDVNRHVAGEHSYPLLAQSGHAVLHCICLLLTQSGHWTQAPPVCSSDAVR